VKHEGEIRRETVRGEHPRSIGWIATTALALGGSNRSLFLIGALIVGQGGIPGQGSAAVPLLIVGWLLSCAAAPGWTELVMLSPNRVGGIAAACTDAFRPYSPVLSALTGSAYWWGWIPTCGLTAILAASAIHEWVIPFVPVTAIAIAIVLALLGVNLFGIRQTARLALPIAAVSAGLAFCSALIPVLTGHVDWHAATRFHLTTPFAGWFGGMTSLMAGLYLAGFAAPSFEAATCQVGETIDPARNVPRAVFASAVAVGLYLVILPVVWVCALGPEALGNDLGLALGPTLAPLFGASAKALALGFMVFTLFLGTLAPLANASRTLAQLADDGIFPRVLGLRSRRDVPWVAILVTAAGAIGFVLIGGPLWLIAAANFTYLIAIGLPSIAVWLLRNDAPQLERPYRAPRGTIALGVAAAFGWMIAAVFGFEQFGLPTVVVGLALTYSGGVLYVWRKLEDRHRIGLRGIPRSPHVILTAMMVAVLGLDGGGYLIAVKGLANGAGPVVAGLQDIFVVVALLTIGAGVALPGIIAESAKRELDVSNETLRRGAEALNAEISERKVAEQRLLYAASHDELTGLANRAYFMERFNGLIARMERRNDHYCAVLFLDLDRFKRVNDSLGHLAGDQLLIAVARRLQRCLRTSDTIARLGGDEFTILLEGVGEREAIVTAERILADLRAPFSIMGRELYASASIGIAVTKTGFDDPDDVLRDADIAMYAAKELGKQRYELFVPELHQKAVSLMQLENDLKGALERREFVLFYQPIVALQSGELSGFEALIRWQHPTRGLVGPNDFVASAEDSGAIEAIGAWVIDEACGQLAHWRDTFSGEINVAVSINVSANQFSKGAELLEQIQRGLRTHHLDPFLLHVEITESAIMRSPEIATTTLVELRRMGIEVHLDDFGTGYSSLGYLQRFPVDTLKIDRSFISFDGSGVGNPEIVKMIASLARALSLETTAEGIETQQQLDALRTLGCTRGQGYFFSRPLCAADATTFIAEHRRARRRAAS
jgi:diguanylate cyclase (GGDEF)-like protein